MGAGDSEQGQGEQERATRYYRRRRGASHSSNGSGGYQYEWRHFCPRISQENAHVQGRSEGDIAVEVLRWADILEKSGDGKGESEQGDAVSGCQEHARTSAVTYRNIDKQRELRGQSSVAGIVEQPGCNYTPDGV